MNTSIATFSVTDLRHKTSKILKEIKEKGYVYIIQRSKTAAAIVDINYLNALKEVYEDYLDILEFDKTVGLKRIPLEDHKKRYSKDK